MAIWVDGRDWHVWHVLLVLSLEPHLSFDAVTQMARPSHLWLSAGNLSWIE